MESLKHEEPCELGLLVADNFRLGYEGEANQMFVAFIDAVIELIAKNRLGQDLELNTVLGTLIESQTRRDLLFVADILQYELIPLLKEKNH